MRVRLSPASWQAQGPHGPHEENLGVMAFLAGGFQAAAKAIVGILLIAAAGIAALAMLVVSSLILAATLMMRRRVPVSVRNRTDSANTKYDQRRPAPPTIDAERTPYGWTADVPGPRG